LGSLGIHPYRQSTELVKLPYDAIILILTSLYLSRNVAYVEWCARFFYWPCHLFFFPRDVQENCAPLYIKQKKIEKKTMVYRKNLAKNRHTNIDP
jgi:hypothetical protein